MSSESTAAAQGCGLGTAMLEVVSLTISVPLVNSALAHGLPPPIGSLGMLVPHSSTKREPAFRMGHAARDGPTPVTSGMRRAMGAVWPRWKPTCAGGAVAASRSLGGATGSYPAHGWLCSVQPYATNAKRLNLTPNAPATNERDRLGNRTRVSAPRTTLATWTKSPGNNRRDSFGRRCVLHNCGAGGTDPIGKCLTCSAV